MTTATLISMALMLAVLLLWVTISRISAYLNRLLERVNDQHANRLLSGLLIVPLQIGALAVLLIAVWFPEQLLLRMAHLSLVLGAIAVGVLAGILFWLPWRAGLDTPLPALITLLIAIPLGVYFLPLDNFVRIFAPQQIVLGGAAGAMAIIVYCLVLWSLRRAVLKQTPISA